MILIGVHLLLFSVTARFIGRMLTLSGVAFSKGYPKREPLILFVNLVMVHVLLLILQILEYIWN